MALVGVGAAVAMIISKYRFGDVHGTSVSFDPSRVAAQIVSGIQSLDAVGRVALAMNVTGKGTPASLAAAIAAVDGVLSVDAGEGETS